MKLAFFLLSIPAFAQLDRPSIGIMSIGIMMDRNGVARSVSGVPGSLTVGPPLPGREARSIARGASTPQFITGELLSTRSRSGSLEFAVRRDDGVWIVREDNAAVAFVPGATGPVLLLPGAVLFASGDETILRRDDGVETRFAIRAAGFFRMSENYVQIRSGAANFALRVDAANLFQLPEPR